MSSDRSADAETPPMPAWVLDRGVAVDGEVVVHAGLRFGSSRRILRARGGIARKGPGCTPARPWICSVFKKCSSRGLISRKIEIYWVSRQDSGVRRPLCLASVRKDPGGTGGRSAPSASRAQSGAQTAPAQTRADGRGRAGARYARNRVPPHEPAGGANGKEANGMRWSGDMRKSGRQGPGETGGERGGAGGRMTKHDIP